MSKITLTNLVNLQNETTAVNAINANNATLVAAIDNTVSRNGAVPSQMVANLDMNSNRIHNLPIPVAQDEPIRLADMTAFSQFQNSVNLSAAVASASASAATATTQAGIATTQASTATTQANLAGAYAAAAQGISTAYASIFSYIPSSEIAAIQAGTSTYDIGPVATTTLATLRGQPLYFPPGSYSVNTSIVFKPTGTSLQPGASIVGAGSGKTIFRNNVVGDQLLNCFSTTNGSVVVTMAWPSHTKVVGDVLTLTNISTHNIGGLDMDGHWMITSVTANTVTFNHYSPATGTTVTTGSCIVTKHAISIKGNSQDVGNTGIMIGIELKGFRIQQVGFPIGSSALKIYMAYQPIIEDVWINGATSDGLTVPVVQGDSDGTSQLTIISMRINDCKRWGLDIGGAGTTIGGLQTGINELSNSYIGTLLCDFCGTAGTGLKYSGGMKWRGQGIHLANAAFTTAQNVGIYIPGGQATSEAFSFNVLTLENSVGTQFQIEALDGMTGGLLEMRNNNTYLATTGFSIDSTTNTVRYIVIQQGIIRAFPNNNPYVAYNATGPNTSFVRIYAPLFKVFGTAGQTQAAGIAFT